VDHSSLLLNVRETFGTSNADLTTKFIRQVVRASPECVLGTTGNNPFFAAVDGISPRDTIEAMLSVQMVAVHNQAMKGLENAALPGQLDVVVDLNLNRVTKLMRIFGMQVDALDRHRDKGAQMTVEEVHVHDRDRAIIGSVNHSSSTVLNDRQNLTAVKRENDEKLINETQISRGAWLKNGNSPGNSNSAPRCGAKTRRSTVCQAPAMANGRCRMRGGSSTGPRTAKRLARSRRARWKHGRYSAEARAEQNRVRDLLTESRKLLTQMRAG